MSLCKTIEIDGKPVMDGDHYHNSDGLEWHRHLFLLVVEWNRNGIYNGV